MTIRWKHVLAAALVLAATSAHAGLDTARAAYNNRQYDVALAEYREAASRGFPQAHFMLSMMYANGEGVPRDPQLAIEHAGKAIDGGDVGAIAIIAALYDHEQSGIADKTKAIEWYRKGIALKDTNSMRHLARHYMRGDGVERDYARAYELFKQAADRDDVLAMLELGKMHEFGIGIPKDARKARTWYETMRRAPPGLARTKQPALHVRLAGLKEQFPSSDNDLYEAAQLFEEAAGVGNPEALYRLGAMYQAGRGVKRDYVRAAALYEQAADRGEERAMYSGGMLFLNGLGVKHSDTEAMNWFREAAEHGHSGAMRQIARHHDEILGTAADHKLAADWYCQAALAEGVERPEKRVSGSSAAAVAPSDGTIELAVLKHCAAAHGPRAGEALMSSFELERRMTPEQIKTAAQLTERMASEPNLTKVIERR